MSFLVAYPSLEFVEFLIMLSENTISNKKNDQMHNHSNINQLKCIKHFNGQTFYQAFSIQQLI